MSEYSQPSVAAATQERGRGIVLGSGHGVTEEGHGRRLASTQGGLSETRINLRVRCTAGLLKGRVHVLHGRRVGLSELAELLIQEHRTHGRARAAPDRGHLSAGLRRSLLKSLVDLLVGHTETY